MTSPSSQQAYNNAEAGVLDSRTPGTNSFLIAWRALQDFTGNWAINNYSQGVNVSNLNRGLIT